MASQPRTCAAMRLADERRMIVYAALCQAADAGETCPGNAALIAAAGYRNDSSASGAIHDLAERGLVRQHGVGIARRIEIVATGRITADPFPPREPEIFTPRRPVRDIIAMVARCAGLEPADIIGRRRQRIYVRPRVIACHFARAEGWSYSQIGQIMNGRDHSTVIHACELVEPLLATDRLFARLFRRCGEVFAGLEPRTFTIAPCALPAAPPRIVRPPQLRPIEVDESDPKQMYDLYRRRRSAEALLHALRREFPERCAA